VRKYSNASTRYSKGSKQWVPIHHQTPYSP
jgi:hypothetical protein